MPVLKTTHRPELSSTELGDHVLQVPVGVLLVYTFVAIALVVILYVTWILCKRLFSDGQHRTIVYQMKCVSARLSGHQKPHRFKDAEVVKQTKSCNRNDAVVALVSKA